MTYQNTAGVLVCIVHYRTPDRLLVCLESLEKSPPGAPHRILIADNSHSLEPLPEDVCRFKGVAVHPMPENIGFSAANNRMVKGAPEEYFFFLNPDTEVEEGALESLLSFMEENRDVAAVGPMNLGPDGEIQFSCRRFPGYRTAMANRYSALTRFFPNNLWSSDYLQAGLDRTSVQEVDWVSGAALVVRKTDFEKVGGFDEDYFLYAEDVDLCYRLRQEGLRICYYPHSRIRHSIGASSRENRFRSLWERHRSMYLFYRKHYSLEIPILDFITLSGIVARGIAFFFLELAGRSPHR